MKTNKQTIKNESKCGWRRQNSSFIDKDIAGKVPEQPLSSGGFSVRNATTQVFCGRSSQMHTRPALWLQRFFPFKNGWNRCFNFYFLVSEVFDPCMDSGKNA